MTVSIYTHISYVTVCVLHDSICMHISYMTVVCSVWQSVYVHTYLTWQNSKHAVLCTWLIIPLPTITMSISGNLKKYCEAAQPTGNIQVSLLPHPWEQSSFFIWYKGLHVLPHLMTAAMLRHDKRTFCIIRLCRTDPKMYLKSCVLKLGWNVMRSAKRTHSLQNLSGNTVSLLHWGCTVPLSAHWELSVLLHSTHTQLLTTVTAVTIHFLEVNALKINLAVSLQ